MIIDQDARFRAERERFRLHFCCESCVHFDDTAEECTLGFPVEDHRRARYASPEASLIFCKDYDFA